LFLYLQVPSAAPIAQNLHINRLILYYV
jgi:hypothetical protein